MITSEQKLFAGTIAAIVGGLAYIFTENKRNDAKKAKLETQKKEQELERIRIEKEFPPEYWLARKAETEASVQKRKLQIESDERLELDKREREDISRKEKLEFEKLAPAEYWAQKKVEAEEATRRHQMDLDDQRMKRQLEVERDISEKKVKAFENSARYVERALKGYSL